MAEAAPTYEGQHMACELADLGIQTTAISDSAIYAMMARVNKASGLAGVLLNKGLERACPLLNASNASFAVFTNK